MSINEDLATEMMKNSSEQLRELTIDGAQVTEYNSISKCGSIIDNKLLLLKSGDLYGKLHVADFCNEKLLMCVDKNVFECLCSPDLTIRLLALDIAYHVIYYNDKPSGFICGKDKILSHGQFIARLGGIRATDHVAVIGADPTLPVSILEHTDKVRVTDLNPSRIGSQYVLDRHVVCVEDGYKYTNDILAAADICFVTGMTFSTNTIDSILETAKANRTRLVFYMTSCSHLARFVVKDYSGYAIAVGYPTLDMPGPTPIYVYSDETNKPLEFGNKFSKWLMQSTSSDWL